MISRMQSYPLKNKKRKLKKDYQRKNLKNPFFRRREEAPKKSYKKLIFISSGLLLVSLFWLIFAAPWWKIGQVDIQGLTRFEGSEIEKIVNENKDKSAILVFSKSNIILFDSEDTAQKIKEKFSLADVKIKKQLPNKIKVEISERPYSFIYQEGDKLFFASSDNYLIKEVDFSGADGEEAGKYFIIENKNSSSLIKNETKLNLKSDYLDFVFALKKEFDNYPEIVLEKFIISDQYFNSVFVKIKDGPQIFVNVNDNAREQIERLILVKNTKIKDNFNKLDYIDIRYGDKLYFSPENIIK